MALLDDLKHQSDRRKRNELAHAEHQAALEKEYRTRLLPCMRRTFTYLSELAKHLNYLQPDVEVNFSLPGCGRIPNLRQGDYQVTADSTAEMRKMVFRFRCYGEDAARFKVSPLSVARDLSDLLVKHGIQFYSRDYRDSGRAVIGETFEIQPNIPVSVVVEADFERTLIRLSIINFEAPGTHQASYTPEEITDDFLDDLGNYLVRKNSNLTRLFLPDQVREEIRERLEEEKRERQSWKLLNKILKR